MEWQVSVAILAQGTGSSMLRLLFCPDPRLACSWKRDKVATVAPRMAPTMLKWVRLAGAPSSGVSRGSTRYVV